MSDFKTTAEIFRALLDGERVKRTDWSDDYFIQMFGGEVINQGGQNLTLPIIQPMLWAKVPEPPKVLEFEGIIGVDALSGLPTFVGTGVREKLHAAKGRRFKVTCTEVKEAT